MKFESLEELDPAREFKTQLATMGRDELLEIIKIQNPKYIGQINRIEYVFRNNLSHLNWDDGTPVLERDLTDDDLRLLVDIPFFFSPELARLGFNEEDQRQIHIASDPVLWLRTFLGARPRVYQTLILRDQHHRKVMRFGRRLGKTWTLAAFMLWYAFTHANTKVLVVSPMKPQVGLIYDEVLKLAKKNEMVYESIPRSVTSPQYEIDFSNGSTIRFFTSGMKSNGKTDVARGQEADIIVLDEMDYMGPDDLIALMAMLQNTDEDKMHLKKILIGASTPSGLRNTFWDWNTDAEQNFHAYWFPSYVNPGWDMETENEMRGLYRTEHAWRHEIEADWGESEMGVYPRKYIDIAFQDEEKSWDYRAVPSGEQGSFYTIGVDWDKYTAGVNISILEVLNPRHEDPSLAGKIRLIHREEVRKGEFTYVAAMERIVELNGIFNPRHIYIDRGYGEVQLEMFIKYGMDHPQTGLHKKIKGIQFSQKIEIMNPFTKQPEKRGVKGFMIDNLYRMLEDERIIFTGDDNELYFQLISYQVIAITQSGEPKFGAGGQAVDHAHDSLILAAYAIADNYDELLNPKFGSKPIAVSNHAFLPMFSIETREEQEIAEDKWGKGNRAAPVLARRAMTARIGGRNARRPDAIRRKMF